jgi:RNA polymerase sigma-70 factor, ECF subfamily
MPPNAAAADLFDADYVQRLRRDMMRFAHLQLRDEHQAEDAVQEALAAALAGCERFASRASLKTWVLGILKNKILDIFRQRARRREQALDDGAEANQIDIQGHFDETGHWAEETRPADWGSPEQALASRQFWVVFEACLTRLPEVPARAFMMRELMGLETLDICRELGINANHCGVLMHRARLGLRACLAERWFNGEGASA